MTGRCKEQSQTPLSEAALSRREIEVNAYSLSQKFSQAFMEAPDFRFDAAQVFLGADSHGNPLDMSYDDPRLVEVGRHVGLWHFACDYSVEQNWRQIKIYRFDRNVPSGTRLDESIVIQSKWDSAFPASRKPRITYTVEKSEVINGKMTITERETQRNNAQAVGEAKKLLQDFLQTSPSA